MATAAWQQARPPIKTVPMPASPAAQTISIGDALAQIRANLRANPALALHQAQMVREAVPQLAEAHRLEARALIALGREDEAQRAELAAISASVHDPELMEAGAALAANDLPRAEPILRNRLKAVPHDVAAIRMLAEIAGRLGRYRDAENLLRRAVELAPAFHAARSNLATVLHRQNRTEEALAELDVLMAQDADNPTHFNLKAAALGRIGEYEEAAALYRAVLAQVPEQPKVWMSQGHVLKTLGQRDESIAAYREAIRIAPHLGEAWWSLANMKTVRFTDADLAAMEGALGEARLSIEDRFHLEFALGKAEEDRIADDPRRAEKAFGHYLRANATRRQLLDHDPDEIHQQVARHKALFTCEFIESRAGQGHDAPDPIFILGMPRAGSTLIEQILSSHSMVEGTMELPDIPALAARVGREGGGYPRALADLDADAVAAIGRDYIARTRVQRKSEKPLFIDKLPNNWVHAGFIHLILPNAKIIDARRHPLDCCFSNFKQHFARGQSFSYDLADMGRYYADYVDLMAHFDAVMPGRVIRVIHEELVEDQETVTRRLLDALGLPFEEACLRFWENDRAVRTASSEQVRRPINRDGVDQWKRFDPWLGELRTALGDVLDAYPAAPAR